MTAFSPRTVVSLQPSVTDTLARLGLLDRVIACTRHCNDVAPEVTADRFVIEDSWSARADEIMAARADLVIASVPYQAEAVAEILKSGTRFLGLSPKTLADVYRDIAAIASIMGVAERGEKLIAGMESEIVAVRQRVSAASRPRVFCEEWGKPIITSEPWVRDLVSAAGGEFLGDPGRRVSAEAVADAAPEAIIFAWTGAGDRVPMEDVITERGWSDLPAVRNRRVFVVRDSLLNTPSPVLIDGLKAIAWALHPDLFPAAAGIRQMAQV